VVTNFSTVRMAGSCFLGCFFAVFLTFVIYQLSGRKNETLVLLLPLAILSIRLVLWVWECARKRDSEAKLKRYEEGGPPVGQ
jgi:hypothetical protein